MPSLQSARSDYFFLLDSNRSANLILQDSLSATNASLLPDQLLSAWRSTLNWLCVFGTPCLSSSKSARMLVSISWLAVNRFALLNSTRSSLPTTVLTLCYAWIRSAWWALLGTLLVAYLGVSHLLSFAKLTWLALNAVVAFLLLASAQVKSTFIGMLKTGPRAPTAAEKAFKLVQYLVWATLEM